MANLTPSINEIKASIDEALDNLQAPLQELNLRSIFHLEVDLYQLLTQFI